MREFVGTVEILEPRLYPRYPRVLNGRAEITTADELVNVEDGVWPVYRDDDGAIYWEMEGELVKVEDTIESLGDGMFLRRPTVRALRERVIFRSMTFTAAEFAKFRATDPLVVGDDETRRLVFTVTL